MCFSLFPHFSLFVRYTSPTTTISHDNNNHRTSKHASTSWRSGGSPSCLGGSSHGWVPDKTDSTPVPTSVVRLFVAHQHSNTHNNEPKKTQHKNNTFYFSFFFTFFLFSLIFHFFSTFSHFFSHFLPLFFENIILPFFPLSILFPNFPNFPHFSTFFQIFHFPTFFHSFFTFPISTASACSTAVREAAKRVGALSLIPSCLDISGHPSGSQQGHPRYTGARSAGRLWVAHEIRQHSTQCRNTPNKVGEQCRPRARALSVARRSTRTTTTDAEMLTISVCAHTDCAERASTVCSVKCRILRRIPTEVRNASVFGVSRGDENRRELLRKFMFEYPCW